MRFIGIFLVCILTQACTSPPERKPDISFYYWKTSFKLSPNERSQLQDNNVSKLYVRYFDIVLKDKTPMPESPVSFESLPENFEVVPVVYIRNEVMLGKVNLEDLATKTVSLIDQINNHHHLSSKEIQLDCDWTLTSQENYFQFVRLIRKLSGKVMSATIRLHQVKYFQKTGVPEVDRGVLMYYNMGRISPDSTNSIYDSRIASQYTKSLKQYPLSLDIALPVFSWGVHLRNNRVIGLLGKLNESSFNDDERFSHSEIPIFEANENVMKFGYYFEKGDRIKIESVSDDDLMEMTSDLTDNLATKPHEIIFFDLDSVNVNQYADEKNLFKEISHRF